MDKTSRNAERVRDEFFTHKFVSVLHPHTCKPFMASHSRATQKKGKNMQEKIMVADTLAGINGELTRYAGMIAQSENKELKQTLKQLRNACEQSQEELYQIAREKSYYVPASKATEEEVAHVRQLFTQGTI